MYVVAFVTAFLFVCSANSIVLDYLSVRVQMSTFLPWGVNQSCMMISKWITIQLLPQEGGYANTHSNGYCSGKLFSWLCVVLGGGEGGRGEKLEASLKMIAGERDDKHNWTGTIIAIKFTQWTWSKEQTHACLTSLQVTSLRRTSNKSFNPLQQISPSHPTPPTCNTNLAQGGLLCATSSKMTIRGDIIMWPLIERTNWITRPSISPTSSPAKSEAKAMTSWPMTFRPLLIEPLQTQNTHHIKHATSVKRTRKLSKAWMS